MPTRSYKCTNDNCENKEFELEMSVKEDDIKICPKCGSEVQRLFRPVAWSFTCQGSYNQTRNN